MSDTEAPRVFEAPGGLCVRYRGRLLYSGRDPAGLPRRVAAACDPGPSRLHLVPSPLLWYGVAELLAAMGPGSAALCVEADPELERMAREAMPPELASDRRLAFPRAATVEAALEAARSLGSFRACSLAALSGGESLNAPLYRAMAAALSSEFEAAWRNRAALMILGDRWARNVFDNAASLGEIAPEPIPRIPGPAAVCGAGASLESSLGLLRRASSRGELSIIACDTALGTLLSAGIEPDLTVCLEAQAHNLPDFTCLGSKPVRLVADLSSHPATFRAVRGPKHLTAVRITRSPFLSRIAAALEEGGVPALDAPPLGSVGVHAFQLARAVSGGPLFACGLDFSFLPGKTHARGCPPLKAEERRQARLRRWPGQYESSFRDRALRLPGGLVSDPILLSYARLLSDIAGRGPEGGPEPPALYDLRGGGPSIGARALTLDEAEGLIERSASAARGAALTAGPVNGAAFDPSRAAAAMGSLIRGEIAMLERLRSSMRGKGLLPKEEFLALLTGLDYLWWDFPDQDRIADLPQDLMNRLVPRVESWLSRLPILLERARGEGRA